jgi:5-methylcytosine-specific restriction endonuclease McrA
MIKRCSKCGEYHDISLFRKNRCRKDGHSEYCRDCARIVQRAYREKHREEVNERQCKWARENKEKVNAIQSRYIKNHPEKKEKRNKVIKDWHKKHPEADAESRKKYRLNHHDEMISYTQNRRAKLKGNGGTYTAKEFSELCKLFDYKCACCGEKKPLTVDHIIPIKHGGANIIENIQPLCQSCNSKKHTKIIDFRYARV